MTAIFLMKNNRYHLYHFDYFSQYEEMVALHEKWCERVVPSFLFPFINEVFFFDVYLSIFPYGLEGL